MKKCEVSLGMSEKNDELLLAFFDALSHPIRLKIIKFLHKGEKYISELAREMGISRPLLYMHLAKLEKAGIVSTYIKYFDKPPYVRKFVKAKNIKAIILLPSLSIKIESEE